jgi:hypothetical protein
VLIATAPVMIVGSVLTPSFNRIFEIGVTQHYLEFNIVPVRILHEHNPS